ncbi:MAG TPA: hypothetical protein PLE88_05730, partial [Anaerohalosphaeraceae bacterium]|nr:hypothetical protein [Anaerohalosphaeraceae bacterium]
LSVLAKENKIPFYIAAPTSTIDLTCRTGADIPVEHRDGQEVRQNTAPQDIQVYNPAFDITPSANITAIITERGILDPINPEAIFRHIVP